MTSALPWLLVVPALAAATGWIFFCRSHPAGAAVGVVALACGSAHVLAASYQAGVPADVVRLGIPIKDVAAGLLLVVLLVRELRSGRSPRWLLAPALLLVVALVPAAIRGAMDAPLSDLSLQLRNCLVPFMAAGTGLLLRGRERRRAVQGVVVVITVTGVLALVEYLLPISFARDVLGIGDYWVDVKEQPYFMDPRGSGLPGNFFASTGARRLTGPFGDPLSAGYSLACGVLLVVLSPGLRWRVPSFVVLSLALALTFTRAGAVIVLGGLAPALVGYAATRGRRTRVAIAAGVVAAAVTYLLIPPLRGYLVNVVTGNDGSTLAHINALLAIDDHDYSVLGLGLGGAGAAVGVGTENVVVTLLLQCGVVGAIAYLVALALVARRSVLRWSRLGLRASGVGAWLAVAVTMAISEQLLTFNAGYVLVLVLCLAPLGREPTPTDDRGDEYAEAHPAARQPEAHTRH